MTHSNSAGPSCQSEISAPVEREYVPLISVIIPAFNCEQYLESAVRSAQAQQGCRTEIIVIDDSSTDGTTGVIDRLRSEITSLRIPNSGPGIARNTGASLAHGSWLAFLDADDLWEPDKLIRQLQAARRDDTSVVYTNTRNVGAVRDVDEIRFSKGQMPAGSVFEDLLNDNFVTFSSVLISRSAFMAVGGFDVQCHACEDWDLLLRLAQRYRFSAVSEPLTRYRWANGSFSRRHRLFLKYKFSVVRKALDTLPGRQLSSVSRRRITARILSDSAWAAALSDPLCSMKWYLRAWLYRPFSTQPLRGMVKTMLGRR